jgi:hypothetical protein
MTRCTGRMGEAKRNPSLTPVLIARGSVSAPASATPVIARCLSEGALTVYRVERRVAWRHTFISLRSHGHAIPNYCQSCRIGPGESLY